MSRRVLVLTSSTGSGHDMRAKAFAKWVQRVAPETQVKIEQIIENASLLGRFGVWLYNTIHRHAPSLHNLYFFIVEVIILSQSRRVTFGGAYYRQLLRDYQPTHILSVHDSTNRGYFEDARKVLGEQVKCITYCGEFSGGFGYSMNWINPSCDLFVARTEAAREFALNKGIRPNRSAVFHKLLPPEVFKPPLAPEDVAQRRVEMGLGAHRFTLFLTTGGFGANHHIRFLKALKPLGDTVQFILICGKNQRLQQSVVSYLQMSQQIAYVEGYSSRIPEFLQLCDAVVTRGGANTTMEALHYQCPILYDGIGGLMPQERCTWRYFSDHQAAEFIRQPDDLRTILEDWFEDMEHYLHLKKMLKRLNPKENPRQLLEWILED